jgi:phosphoglycolate phosphatase-like HAD superfamily hydrolase
LKNKNIDIDLIITDIGGVLIKTDEAIISCIKKVVRRKGIPDGSVEDIYSVFGVSIRDYVRAYLPEGYKDRTEECYREYEKIYPFEVMHLLKPFEGIDRTLFELDRLGIRLAVFSCMRRESVDANLSQLKFDRFVKTFSIDDCGEEHKRPDPCGLIKLMELLGAEKGRTMYVGDSPADVQMAKRAGVISVAVKTGALDEKYLEKENPDYLIDSFADIPRRILSKDAEQHVKNNR